MLDVNWNKMIPIITLKQILHTNRHKYTSCMKCKGFCRLYQTVLRTFGSSSRIVAALSLIDIYKRRSIGNFTMIPLNNIKVLDVPGDGNCWIYAFCTSWKINSDFNIETQHEKNKIADFVAIMEKIPNQLKKPTDFQILHTEINMANCKELIWNLPELFSDERKFITVSTMLKAGHTNAFLWVG